MKDDDDEPVSLQMIKELGHKNCHVCQVVVPFYYLEEHEEEHQKNLKNLIEPTREDWLAFIFRESGDGYYSASDDDVDDDGEFIEEKEEGTNINIPIEEDINGEEKTTTKSERKNLGDGFTPSAADAKESETVVLGGEEEEKAIPIAKPYNTSPKESEVEVGENSQGTMQLHKKPRLDCSGADILRSFYVEDSDSEELDNFVAKGEESTLGTSSETNQSEDMGDCVNEKPMTCHLCKKVCKNKEAFVSHLESLGHDRKFRGMLLYTFC